MCNKTELQDMKNWQELFSSKTIPVSHFQWLRSTNYDKLNDVKENFAVFFNWDDNIIIYRSGYEQKQASILYCHA